MPSSQLLKMKIGYYSLSYAAEGLSIGRIATGSSQKLSSHRELWSQNGVRNEGTQSPFQFNRSFGFSGIRAAKPNRQRPVFALPPGVVPWDSIRRGPEEGRRPYSCHAAQTPPTITQTGRSSNDVQKDNRPFAARVTEGPLPAVISSSTSTVIEVGLETQPGSSVLWPMNKSASSNFWSHRLYKIDDRKDILVHYCKCLESTEKVAQLFLNDTVLGFDMEWQVQASAWDSIQDNVSLIQLANRDRIALFQISRFTPAKSLGDLVSPSLKRILESPDITKAGVAIKADSTRLRKYLGIDNRGIFELSHLHKLVKYCHSNPMSINKRLVSLNEQVEEHFGLPLSKDVDVRCGSWTSSLTYDQVHYAATDVYACYCLFHTMDAKRKALDPPPPLPAHAELNLPIRIVQEVSAPVDAEVIENAELLNITERPTSEEAKACSQCV